MISKWDDEATLARLKAAIALGEADIAAGRYVSFDSDDALDDYLKALGKKVRERACSTKAAGDPSARSVADMVGIFPGGPGDLACNSAHLSSFGQERAKPETPHA